MRWSLALMVLMCAAGQAVAQNQPRPRPAPPPAESVAQPGRPGWMVDARNGCWVWKHMSRPAETARWQGACPSGPAEGEGTLEWRYNSGNQAKMDTYRGPMRNGRMNGYGIYIVDGVGRLESNLVDDRAHGFGRWIGTDGEGYEGEWRDGRRSGRGIQTWPNGNRYEGAWRDGRENGHGTLTRANGNRYQGEFRDGRINGQGVFTYADGTRYEGAFRDDRPDGLGAGYSPATGLWYRGNWSGGCFRGADGARWSILRPLSECP